MVDGTPRYFLDGCLNLTPDNSAASLPTHESIALLTSIYGQQALYLDQFIGGEGTLTVSDIHLDQACKPNGKNFVIAGDNRQLVVVDGYSQGHFKDGLIFVLPGHKNFRMATYALLQSASGNVEDLQPVVFSFESISFPHPVFLGDTLEYPVSNLKECTGGIFEGDIVSKKGDIETMVVKGLRIYPTGDNSTASLREDQIIEGAAQALGLLVLGDNKDFIRGDGKPEKIPLFKSVGSAVFKGCVHKGETISYRPELIGNSDKSFFGRVTVLKDGYELARIENINAGILPFDFAIKLLKRAQGIR